jgi:potassium-transporting ATPase ATP-binding subunit
MSVATLDPAGPKTSSPKRIQGGLLDPQMLW